MGKRLVRAKAKICNAGIPYRVPPAPCAPDRTNAVLGVLYLLFNEGYSATAGADLVRVGLYDEAIRPSRVLTELMPDETRGVGCAGAHAVAPRTTGGSRRCGRRALPLEEQDRSRWDGDAIAEATPFEAALRRRQTGPYQLQAAIAACHATATDAQATNWHEIAQLYGRLRQVLATPAVALNRAVAVAMADGPAAGLELVDRLEIR
jgi:RNA polymerase sigma-70 factor (ECF subfamily)